MAKRLREEPSDGVSSVEELCQSVKKLHTIPSENRFPGLDQNQFPVEGPYKGNENLQTQLFQQHEQQLQHQQHPRAQSITDLLSYEQQQQQQEAWAYEKTNMMLRDLHFERMQRLSRLGQ